MRSRTNSASSLSRGGPGADYYPANNGTATSAVQMGARPGSTNGAPGRQAGPSNSGAPPVDLRGEEASSSDDSDSEAGQQPARAGTSASSQAARTPPAPPREIQPRTVHAPIKRSLWTRFWGSVLGVGSHKSPEGFSSNEIRTSKYTLLTFLPVNLFEQFTRIANLYFLLMAALQFIPGLSPTSWVTTVMPLAFVLLVNAVKEGYDDYHRHRSDDDVNSRKVLVLSEGGKEVPVAWRDLHVGDIIMVKDGHEVPADIVLLASSDHKGGLAHVETANLDGETNLKTKFSHSKTSGARTADEVSDWAKQHIVRCEPPNARLYVFDGAVIVKESPDGDKDPLVADNLLLRGCTLRKTDWVMGLVVFTGPDTKIMMNRTKSPRKVTQLEQHMNWLVVSVFFCVVLFTTMLAMGEQIYMGTHKGQWYLQFEDEWPDLGLGFPGWAVQVIRFTILINGLVPISLYVTLEVVKVLQCLMILNSDRKMYYLDADQPFQCHTTNLNEDLGQVQYVLSDKTGTLTQNVMGFVWASINGQLYGKDGMTAAAAVVNLATKERKQVEGVLQAASGVTDTEQSRHALEYNAELVQAMQRWFPPHIPRDTPHSICLDQPMQERLGGRFLQLAQTLAPAPVKKGLSMLFAQHPSLPAPAGEELQQGQPDPAVARFYINLAICNTVVPSTSEDGTMVYQASSPDEEALVQGAAYLGYRLLSRTHEHVQLEYHGQTWTYDVLALLEFNSDRKRMSIICRCPDGKVRLFCKGADTTIMARVRQGQKTIPTVRNHLVEMATAGYRTLCVAERELNDQQYGQWMEQYKVASTSLENREERVTAVSEKIELDLELLGATAVEDKLQDGVPEAIESLIKAGIKVWVLTGDKVETAISIALACRLFSPDMSIVELRERDFPHSVVGNVEQEAAILTSKRQEVDCENEEFLAMQQAAGGGPGASVPAWLRSNVGLVVEGGALAVLLHDVHQEELVRMCNDCRSVVCCRVSPMQKAAVTRMVKERLKAITLGIGDGANDVSMIMAAHIGCGISGREGRAAVLASDFSFAQFRFVARLLLVHGRAMYKRNVEVVLYSFYKNWVFNMPFVYYAFVSAFSAQPIFVTGLIATINVLWSSYVIVAYAILEQDVSPATAERFPALYEETRTATRWQFLKAQARYLVPAIWHSLVIYFVPMYSMDTPDRKGIPDAWYEIGTAIYTAMVITINLKLAMRTRYWTWITHVLQWFCIASFFPFIYLYGLVWPVGKIEGSADMAMIASRLFASPRFWLSAVLLAPVMSLLPDFAVDSFKRTFSPKPFQLFQEVEWQEDLRRQGQRKARQSLPHTNGEEPSPHVPATADNA